MKQWIKAAGIRAIKTVAQTAVAMIGTSVVISEVDWVMVVSASVLSGRIEPADKRCGSAGAENRIKEKDRSNPAFFLFMKFSAHKHTKHGKIRTDVRIFAYI